MKAKAKNTWETVRDSFWFLPTIIAISAMILSITALFIDERVEDNLVAPWIVARIGAEGIRSVLSVIASSTITVTGVVFSITIVALTLAASQLSSRLLRNYMKNTGNQMVLGTFVGTYLYSLMILSRINENKEMLFVPYLSFGIAILLALISLGVLIYFIHHISISIQADYIIGNVSEELNKSLDRMFSKDWQEGDGREKGQAQLKKILERPPSKIIRAPKSGYIQTIDFQGLIGQAKACDGFFRFEHRPGDFVLAGNALVNVFSKNSLKNGVKEKIEKAFVLGKQRSWEQDVEFSVNQLVEIALRALSPGINDTFTALACVDQLAVGIGIFMEKDELSPFVFDEQGQLRLSIDMISFNGFTEASFDKIRQSAQKNPAVIIRMLERLCSLTEKIKNDDQKQVLVKQARMIMAAGLRNASEENDRMDIENRFKRMMKAFEKKVNS